MSPKELLTLIVATPLFLFLSNLLPLMRVLFVVLWIIYLCFDVASTYVFYREDPSQFPNNERNKLFVWFTNKFGFQKATLLFPLLIEIPLLLFFAALPLQILYINMFPLASNNLWTCFAASLGISAIGHLQAAHKNTKHNNTTTKKHNPDQDNPKHQLQKEKTPKKHPKVTYLDPNVLQLEHVLPQVCHQNIPYNTNQKLTNTTTQLPK